MIDAGAAGTVTALLGPTNTGKTHVAVERMLAHRSGMIGLPLRLLAREVYDRVVAARGPDQVALVTGEEKIVPPGARYWVCTVESMPVDRPVAFTAVDEIQLAADPARGHVFTDRILRLRGTHETFLLGAETIAPLLRELVPTVQIRSQPRLSRLSYAGPRKLVALPPRSAVVAFSAARVYELAERLRRRHGGAAVVLGALSPRARNAQVALFQSGEVQHLIATDAIGMGLNMDVAHVALAGLEKWDGRSLRSLRADEVAQIAGRAGRWRRDGTFGETGGIDPLAPEVVDAVEHHAFPPLTRLWWRNADLDFSSPAALRASLEASPPRRFLLPARDGDDVRALARLTELPEVRARLGDPDRLRLLWDVCGVPDFGNVLPEHHAALLAQVFVRLVDHHGSLPDDFLERQVARLDRTDGDIDTLMGRIAGIRVWTYVANRPGWVSDARGWQARTRDVEDRLSDALHRQLVARFVDTRTSVLVRQLAGGEPESPVLRPSGEVLLGGERLGVLRGLRFEVDPGASPSPRALAAVRKAVGPLVAERFEALLSSPDGAFGLDPAGRLRWDGAPVADLVRGDDWRRPRLRVLRLDALEGDARGRLVARLERWLAGWLASLGLEPGDGPPPARGLVHAVGQGLGAVPLDEVADLVAALDGPGRRLLAAAGVRLGRAFAWSPALVARVRERHVLARAWDPATPDLPDDDGRLPFRADWPPGLGRALHFAAVGLWRVRVDTAEALLAGGDRAARELGVPDADWSRLRGPLRALVPAPRRSRERRRWTGRQRRREG